MSGDFSEHREKIDRIDDEILRLLNERSKSVIEIGKLKKQRDAEANLHTSAREATIIARLTQQIPDHFHQRLFGRSIEKLCPLPSL